ASPPAGWPRARRARRGRRRAHRGCASRHSGLAGWGRPEPGWVAGGRVSLRPRVSVGKSGFVGGREARPAHRGCAAPVIPPASAAGTAAPRTLVCRPASALLVVTEAAQRGLVVGPAGADAHPGFEEDLAAEQAFHRHPRLAADLAQA